MEDKKIELIRECLKKTGLIVTEQILKQSEEISKIDNLTTLDFDKHGDLNIGAELKMSAIKSSQYHLGYLSGAQSQLLSIFNLLDLSNEQIERYITTLGEPTKNEND